VGTEWRQESFRFDYVYSGPNSNSATTTSTTSSTTPSRGGQGYTQLYPQCVAPVVDGLFLGYHGCVLAYGQTGAGKSYTMGSDQERCWQVRHNTRFCGLMQTMKMSSRHETVSNTLMIMIQNQPCYLITCPTPYQLQPSHAGSETCCCVGLGKPSCPKQVPTMQPHCNLAGLVSHHAPPTVCGLQALKRASEEAAGDSCLDGSVSSRAGQQSLPVIHRAMQDACRHLEQLKQVRLVRQKGQSGRDCINSKHILSSGTRGS
jgi:hypothetical protein